MSGWRYITTVLVTVGTLIPPSSRGNVASGETRTKLNGSTVEFNLFRQKFHRMYEVGGGEFSRRYLHFQDAAMRHMHLSSFSTEPQSAKYGINQFSDLSQKEFRDIYLRAISDTAPLFPGLTVQGLPAKFDWRDKAVVAPVQNQLAVEGIRLIPEKADLDFPESYHLPFPASSEHFSSCIAHSNFPVVGAVQSIYAIGGSQLEQLSVQQVVDCSIRNEGCNGGSPSWALSWLSQTRVKLVTQSEYPYKAKTGVCHFFPQSHDGVTVKNFTVYDFSGQEEAMMAQLVKYGPLVAVVDAVSWQDYLGGIIQHHCSSRRSNHAVLVVGYDTTGEIPYWIVQNSWGTTWGNEGYVYIKTGADICGIADSVAAVFL